MTEITEAGGRAVVASCDVRRGDMLKAAVTLAEEIFGGLDFVFANAGSFSMGEAVALLSSLNGRRDGPRSSVAWLNPLPPG